MKLSRRTIFKNLTCVAVGYMSSLFNPLQAKSYIVKRTVFFPKNKNITNYIKDSKINLTAINKLDDQFYSKGYLLNLKSFSKNNQITYQYSFKSKKIYSIWRKKARIACNIDEASLKNNGHKVAWNYWTGKNWRPLI